MQCFDLIPAQEKVIPIIASIPHSGMWIPEDTRLYFNQHHLTSLRNTDWFLDSLFSFLPSMGISVLKANFSRYVIDVNRALSRPLVGPYQKSPIYSKNTWGEEIYTKKPSQENLEGRINQYYRPYHKALEELLINMTQQSSPVLLLDLHSFMGPIRNDVCLGDNHGNSCSLGLLNLFRNAFSLRGYDTVVNSPFSGGHIVKYYSNFPGIYSLQIELRYTTYLDGQDLDSGVIPDMDCKQFSRARENLKLLFSELIPKVLSLQSSLQQK